VQRGRAFTLIELLVAIGIIAVLTGLTIPVISRVRDSAKRSGELSNLRQLTAACVAYAMENDGTLPPGRVAISPPGQDDYTWISYKNCWGKLLAGSQSLNNINSCTSVREVYGDADDFGTPEADYGAPDDTKVGWIYWGGRDDLYLNGKLQYRSTRRLGQHPTPGSQTLWTCWCWDSSLAWAPSMCPHVGLNCVIYPEGVAIKPPPDGLGVALDDGSASFVRWQDMITIQQANGYKLYYQP
jgi:prepilin-type N-terminal cleavage/methylation domain-containing protein